MCPCALKYKLGRGRGGAISIPKVNTFGVGKNLSVITLEKHN
jgi:hypothetical protein